MGECSVGRNLNWSLLGKTKKQPRNVWTSSITDTLAERGGSGVYQASTGADMSAREKGAIFGYGACTNNGASIA
jgi:hypothetical protein